MTNMESLEQKLSEQERQSRAYDRAIASIEADKTRQTAQGYAVIASLMSGSDGDDGPSAFTKVSSACKLFLIGFAFLVPSLLVWRVLL
ncbi:MAG: hypothetical protein AB8B58_18790 [Roseobacter sp.]